MSETVHVASPHVGIDRTERNRRRAVRGFAVSSAVVVALCASVAVISSSTLCLVAYAPFIAALVFLLGVLTPSGRPIMVPGTVAVEGDALVVAPAHATPAFARRQIPLADIVQGFWEAPSQVHLVTRSGESVVIRLARDEGERLLQAAGVAVSERVLRVPLANIASRLPAGATLLGMGLALIGLSTLVTILVIASNLPAGHSHESVRPGVAVLAALLGAGYTLLALLRSREAVVGTDGVRYRRFFRARFIPHSSVTRVETYAAGVKLTRRDGSVVRLRTLAAGALDAEARRAVLLDRIRQAMSAESGAEVAQVSLERLDRGERSFATWRAELGKLLSGTSDYRSSGLSAAELGGVIEDASAPAARRIAAVVALGAAQPEEAKRRVRIVTPACADDELRRALERAAEGEIDEDVVEREEKAARRSLSSA